METNSETEAAEKTEPLELAKDAIAYVLERVREDENIRYHMGALTEAFERLKAAHSALNGLSEEAIEGDVFIQLKRKPYAIQMREVNDVMAGLNNGHLSAAEALEKIQQIVDRA